MKFYVVGYEWCPHYQNVLAMCRTAHLKHAPIVVENHDQLVEKVNGLLKSWKQVGQPAETSPQIVLHTQGQAICIPGEDAFKETSFYRQYSIIDNIP